uniref:Uncharacterized protein n=1 Tax=Moniliophthora roreri TaxID=221103 RepID=A0A0W0FX35_MONRR
MEVSSTCILKLEDDPDGPKFMGLEGDNEVNKLERSQTYYVIYLLSSA